MKKIISIVLAVFVVLPLGAVAFADDLQEDFLKDMATGLVERWNIGMNENSTPEDIMGQYKRLVEIELDHIGKYQSESFQNKKFDLLAKAYIEGCQLQLNALKYYKDRQDLYIIQWEAAYKQRVICLVAIYDYYGLDITDEMIDHFRSYNDSLNNETQSASSPMNYTVATKDCIIEIVSQEFDIKDSSSGIIFNNKDVRITAKNICPLAMSNFIITIDLLDDDLNIVDTAMGISSTLVQPNQSVTVSGFNLSYIPYALKVSNYSCRDENRNSYTGYVPDAPILFYDNTNGQ